MPYDHTKDPVRHEGATPTSGCRCGGPLTPSDTDDLDCYVKAIRSDTGGQVTFIPSKNADADTVTVTLAAGEVFSMFQIRRILETGTAPADLVGGWE